VDLRRDALVEGAALLQAVELPQAQPDHDADCGKGKQG
jgi:hypothetical protein